MKDNRFFSKPLIIIFLSLSTTFYSSANGGVIDIGFFKKTKNIQLLRKANISLLKENLNLIIEGDYTIVEVEYTIRNNGKKDELMYGFPVDAFSGNFHGDYSSFDPFEINSWNKECNIINYFKAQENGQSIKVTNWVADSIYTAKANSRARRVLQVYRKWHVFKLLFSEGETKTIHIKYKVQNNKRDNIHGFEFIHNYSNRNFTYDLSPASTWGNGKIGEFNLTIDTSHPSNFEIDFDIQGITDLINEGNQYYFQAFDYDLQQSERININYDVSKQRLTYFMNKNRLPQHFIKRIRSSNNDHSTAFLFDNNPKTSWTGKVGDWIEIEFNDIFEKNKRLLALMALNGNYSNHLEFMNNGKLIKCQLVLNDALLYNTEPWKSDEGSRIIKVPKSNFKALRDMKGNAVTLAQGTPLYLDSHYIRSSSDLRNHGRFKLQKIRIKILAIEEGVAMDGTCSIAELYLL